MFNRTHSMLAFLVIVATCTAGLLHVSWWAIVACASLLAIHSLTTSPLVLGRFPTASIGISSPTLFVSVILNSAAASLAAYILGRVIGWAWGL